MPQSADNHRGHLIKVGSRARTTVSAKRDIDIIAKPCRKRDVPPMPKFRRTLRLKRCTEIIGKPITEQQRYTDSHIAISREITIKLNYETEYGHCVLEAAIQSRIVKHTVDKVTADKVGNDNFLYQSGNNEKQPLAYHCPGRCGISLNLR